MDYMLKNADYFSQYVTEDFEQYVNRKRSDHSYGNNLEMQAMAEMYSRTIEVHQYSIDPINIFFGMYKTDNAPIRLSYHYGVHYNSVVDPYSATVGVGLGLAGHKPGVSQIKCTHSCNPFGERILNVITLYFHNVYGGCMLKDYWNPNLIGTKHVYYTVLYCTSMYISSELHNTLASF
jgi:hypothetical protein